MKGPPKWRVVDMRARAALAAASLLTLSTLLAALPGPAAAAATVPTYYSDTLVAGGLSAPRSLDFLPDGRIIVVENNGRFLLVNGTSNVSLGTLTGISTSGEQGLLGVAIDPDFPVRPYLYVHYTTANYVQIARFNFTNASGPGPLGLNLSSKLVLLGDMPNQATNHNGGTVRFGPDKMLYISIGDDAQGGCEAQDLTYMAGKILRIKVDDTVDPADRATLAPSDNPFFGNASVNATLVWAYGLRNPFRFDIDPVTGTLFIGDVGQSAFEEVDRVPTGGLNLGWPYYEANATYRTSRCPQDPAIPAAANLTFPIYAFPNIGSAIILGTVYRGVDYPNDSSFPPEFDQNLFYIDFYKDPLHVLRSPNNLTNWSLVAGVDAVSFADGLSYSADFQEGPDGALYWVSDATSELRRISYDSVPQITTAALPFGTVGVAYSAQLAASGGPPPFDWSMSSGALPAGLSVNNGTGLISGTPTTAGNVSFVVQVNTSAARSGTRAFNIDVADPVSIAPSSLPDAIENQSYTVPLAALGGVSPFTWALTAGALPPGLILSATVGHITGMPTAFGHFTFTVRADDVQGRFATIDLSIHVIEALGFANGTLPDGRVNTWYEATVGGVGGTPPYAFAVNGSSALPAGLSFGASNGTLYGTPTSAATVLFDLDIVDAGGQASSATFALVIAPPPGGPPLISTASLPPATVGVGYGVTITAVEGSAPLSWSADVTALPPGISFAAGAARLHGSPLAVGNWTFNITVTDSQARSDTRQFTLRVLPLMRGITIVPLDLQPGELGIAYLTGALTFTGVNVSNDVRWSATGLPAGLTLGATSGILSGVPTEAGTFNLTVRAYDNVNAGVEAQVAAQLVIAKVTITTGAALPAMTQGVGVIVSLAASGMSGALNWSVVNGSLPPGLTLDANGTLHGTPTAAGNYTATIRAARAGSSGPNFEDRTWTISVAPVAGPPYPPVGEPPSNTGLFIALAVTAAVVALLLVAARKRHHGP